MEKRMKPAGATARTSVTDPHAQVLTCPLRQEIWELEGDIRAPAAIQQY